MSVFNNECDNECEWNYYNDVRQEHDSSDNSNNDNDSDNDNETGDELSINIKQEYKVFYYYNDEIKGTYTYINFIVVENVSETEIKCIIDEIICKIIIIKNTDYKHHNNNANDTGANDTGANDTDANDCTGDNATNSETRVVCDYHYINPKIMNLLHACQNCDDSASLAGSLNQSLCDGFEYDDSTCGSSIVDDNDDDYKCLYNAYKAYASSSNINHIDINMCMDVEEDKKEDITSSSKPKLNFNKIKNIIQKYEKEVSSLKKISIHKKLNNIIKKITKKIKVEITKDVVNYGNILETYSSKKTNKNVNDLLNAFYHLVLNKINSKIDG